MWERLCAHVSVWPQRVWEGWLTWERGQMVFRVYLIKHLTPIYFTDVVQEKENLKCTNELGCA